jgi:hypothetical protein
MIDLLRNTAKITLKNIYTGKTNLVVVTEEGEEGWGWCRVEESLNRFPKEHNSTATFRSRCPLLPTSFVVVTQLHRFTLYLYLCTYSVHELNVTIPTPETEDSCECTAYCTQNCWRYDTTRAHGVDDGTAVVFTYVHFKTRRVYDNELQRVANCYVRSYHVCTSVVTAVYIFHVAHTWNAYTA